MYASEDLNRKLPYAFGNELGWLRNTAKDLNYAVMIGAGPGIMGMALMEGNPKLNLLIIDIQTCEYARIHLDQAGFPNVGFAVADSSVYGREYKGPKLDLLLVDGDHSLAGVTKDASVWMPHVKPGGIVFFHDYININDDPNNGVAEFLAVWDKAKHNVDEIDQVGVSMVYRKREYV